MKDITFCNSKYATRPVLYTDTVGGEQTLRDDLWAVSTQELNDLEEEKQQSFDEGRAAGVNSVDWEMLLSEIELGVIKDFLTSSLDSSDQSKWGEEYKALHDSKTITHNNAIRVAVQAFRARLLNHLSQSTTPPEEGAA